MSIVTLLKGIDWNFEFRGQIYSIYYVKMFKRNLDHCKSFLAASQSLFRKSSLRISRKIDFYDVTETYYIYMYILFRAMKFVIYMS